MFTISTTTCPPPITLQRTPTQTSPPSGTTLIHQTELRAAPFPLRHSHSGTAHPSRTILTDPNLHSACHSTACPNGKQRRVKQRRKSQLDLNVACFPLVVTLRPPLVRYPGHCSSIPLADWPDCLSPILSRLLLPILKKKLSVFAPSVFFPTICERSDGDCGRILLLVLNQSFCGAFSVHSQLHFETIFVVFLVSLQTQTR